MEQIGSAYANALVEAAQSKGSLDAVHADSGECPGNRPIVSPSR